MLGVCGRALPRVPGETEAKSSRGIWPNAHSRQAVTGVALNPKPQGTAVQALPAGGQGACPFYVAKSVCTPSSTFLSRIISPKSFLKKEIKTKALLPQR